jgi:hypothetical protein
LACVWSVLTFWVAVTGWGVLLACPRRQSGTCRGRNRRRHSRAVARLLVRRLRPRQNPDRASPARRGEHPNLSGRTVRCARPGWSLTCEDISHRAFNKRNPGRSDHHPRGDISPVQWVRPGTVQARIPQGYFASTAWSVSSHLSDQRSSVHEGSVIRHCMREPARGAGR